MPLADGELDSRALWSPHTLSQSGLMYRLWDVAAGYSACVALRGAESEEALAALEDLKDFADNICSYCTPVPLDETGVEHELDDNRTAALEGCELLMLRIRSTRALEKEAAAARIARMIEEA